MIDRRRLAEFASEILRERIEPQAVELLGSGKVGVSDATLKCRIDGSATRAFAIVSAADAPDLVARGTQNIRAMRQTLPRPIAGTVLKPLGEGRVDGLSTAIWPWQKPIFSTGRLMRRAQMRIKRQRLLDWSYDFVAGGLTRAPGDNAVAGRFIPDLERVAFDQRHGEAMRADARRALDRLDRGRWATLVSSLEHGDLWHGNFLSGKRGDDHPLYVIDWAGAQIDGYPVYDFARLSMSLGVTPSTGRRIVRRFADLLDCTPDDLVGYALCSLGNLSGRLEQFPPHRYYAMADRVHRHMRAMAAAA